LPFTINGQNQTPTISSLSPPSFIATDPPFVLTINGSNFVQGTTVTFGTTPPVPATYVSDSEVTVPITASDITAAGTSNVLVTVTNPPPGGGTSSPFTLTVGSNPTPTISSLSPASITIGDPSFTNLTINGSNFVQGATVTIGAAAPAAPTYVSASELTVVPNISTAGTFSVIVTNPAPAAGPSASFTFTINSTNLVPAISSLSPASVVAGNSNLTNLTVNGSNFVYNSTVNWNGVARTANYVSDSQLTVPVSPSDISSVGTASVSVTNPTPGGGTSTAFTFAINSSNPAPIISSISPASVTAGAAGFTLTVTGNNFVPNSTVNWNRNALTPTNVTASLLTVQVPAADIPASSAGTFSVTVTTPSNGFGLVFTAKEPTDIVPMNVAIINVRNGGATFDVIVTYATQAESYRGVCLTGTAAQLPAKMINSVSKLVQVAPDTSGYGTTISATQISLQYAIPSNLSTCFSASDFTVGDGPGPAVFDANSSLDNVEIINLLLVPGVTDSSVISAALSFAERKRAFAILDPPPQAPAFGSSTASPQPIQYWMTGLNGNNYELPESLNGALYFPYLTSADPITGTNIPMAPSGFVAGVYAATDASRGVWKAPAGLATILNNTTGPVLLGAMNDPQQGVLNLDSINCLRSFSGTGTVVWGSRTLVANNTAYQQSKYVPVRRMTLFIEQTLLANLRWVVFEPNDEPLWIAIKSSIETFLLSLYRQGGLQGDTPDAAFQVKCDSSTTTSVDQANGIVNIVVAFAPLKPAEFVIIQIAQLAGQTAGS